MIRPGMVYQVDAVTREGRNEIFYLTFYLLLYVVVNMIKNH